MYKFSTPFIVLLCAILSLSASFAQIKQSAKKVSSPSRLTARASRKTPIIKTTVAKTAAPKPLTSVAEITTTATASTTTATTASQPASSTNPPGALSFMGSSPLSSLFNRLTREDTTRHGKPVGNLGIGATLFLGGSASAGFILKKPLYYLTAGAGMYANKTTYTPTNDLLLFGGGGIPLKNHFKLGAIISVALLSSSTPSYNSTTQSVEVTKKNNPSIGFGLQGSIEIRHVWVTATLHKKMG